MNHINDKIAKDYWYKKNNKIVYSEENFSECSSMDFVIINATKLSYFYKVTGENKEAEFTVLIALYNILLQRYIVDGNVLNLKSFFNFKKESPSKDEIKGFYTLFKKKILF